jgi:hypothetical protein
LATKDQSNEKVVDAPVMMGLFGKAGCPKLVDFVGTIDEE